MVIDRYTKTVLTVIALCLVINIVHDMPIISKAFAQLEGNNPQNIVHVSIDHIAASVSNALPVNCENCGR